MKLVTINELTQLVGVMARETIKARLSSLAPVKTETRRTLYNSEEALARIFEVIKDGKKQENDEERYDRVKADLLETKLAALRGSLVQVDRVRSTWTDLAVALKTRLAQIAPNIESRFQTGTSPNDVRLLVETEVNEALADLVRASGIPLEDKRNGSGNGHVSVDVADEGEPEEVEILPAKKKRGRPKKAKADKA